MRKGSPHKGRQSPAGAPGEGAGAEGPAGRPGMRGRALACAVAGVLACLGVAVGATSAGATSAAPASAQQRAAGRVSSAFWPNEVTGAQDNLRTDWDPHEAGLSPSVVGGGSFGRVFSAQLRGQVYAQPLVARGIVIAATENDWVYGLNAGTGATLWAKKLGSPWPASAISCTDLAPNVGITGAPVYDPSTGIVYLVDEQVLSGDVRRPRMQFVAMRAETGRVLWTKTVSGPPVNGSARFDAFYQMQRPALMLLGGSVYAAFGSHCDKRPYTGYVAGVNTTTHALTLWSDESGVTNDRAGIWQSGGGLMSDGAGRIYFTSGNGVSPPPGPGYAPPGQLAESVVRLRIRRDGALTPKEFFSPADAPSLDAADRDFGAGGPVGLPFGSTYYPHLLVQAGKDGRVFLLNSDDLTGREQGAHGGDGVVGETGPFAGQWGHPATFGDTRTLTSTNVASSHDYVYYVGRSDPLRLLRLVLPNGKRPALEEVDNTSYSFGYTSGSPVVTSNGPALSSAVVWVVRCGNGGGQGATLNAFVAGPKLSTIWSAPIGTASKFSVPATSRGLVYVGTRDGRVLAFGSTAAAPLGGAPQASFASVRLSSAHRRVVTVTARRAVTVTGVSATTAGPGRPFSVGRVTMTTPGSRRPRSVTFPARLAPGDRLHAAVAFRPLSPGGVTGTLAFATASRRFPLDQVPLYGDGTRPGLAAAPRSVLFKLVTDQAVTNVPVGISAGETVDITNTGASSETVASVTRPAGPFRAVGLPTPGARIRPGQSLAVTITFTPGQAGPARGAFTITTADGRGVTVPLRGDGLAPVSQLTASPSSVRFGRVRTGRTATVAVAIVNAGNQPTTITASSPPGAPFHIVYQVASQLPFNPGYDLRIIITFRPRAAGRFRGRYLLRWRDRSGEHTLAVTLAGSGVP